MDVKCCSSCLSMFFSLFLLLRPSTSLSLTSSSPPPGCRDDERSALLEFRQGFTSYPMVDSYYTINYGDVEFDPHKLGSWKLGDGGKGGNCCTWDGVECHAESGHVIGLDLCCTGLLHDSINSSSSLFRLVHLQKLNLAYTIFDESQIPPALGNLTGLTSLNLSTCALSGQIPEQILVGLTNLSSLDLSNNEGLELVKPGFGDLARSLTKLEEVDLSLVSISSLLPDVLTNLSSLASLTLENCGLQGHIPQSIFSMPNLKFLDLSLNSLSGHLPKSLQSSRLESLFLGKNHLSGELPASIGNLVYLDLSWNRFQGSIPSFTNTTRLNYLYLRYNMISGALPSAIGNLTQLTQLVLNENRLIGQIPWSQILNLNQLVYLDLSQNMLSGTIPIDNFFELIHLEVLMLAFNNFSAVTNSNNRTTSHSSKITVLNLASCDLHEFPELFLSGLQQLTFLDLSSNKIHGLVPLWFQNVSRQNLMFLNLSSNSLTGFAAGHSNSVELSWERLAYLDLSFNELQGPLPLPPESISSYRVSDNRLSGDIRPNLCSRSFIQVLDLSKNNFTGGIPECFSNLTGTLTLLSLQNNNFSGGFPQLSSDKNCSLKMLDLHNNQFDGPLPRSLSGCSGLEFLNFGHNMFEDTFPSWLGVVAGLRVLILRSNRFHGAIEEPETSSEFQSLQIIDLSQNGFRGNLPAKYFQCWKPMETSVTEGGQYLGGDGNTPTAVGYIGYNYDFTAIITNKGMEMEYRKILVYLKAIDFSSNNFSGEIPESLESLKGLRLLNFSNNNLGGHIPSILGGLTNLEALDLSNNSFSGEIPQQLTRLSFLSFFNVSSNRLLGPIPRSTQFDTFKNTSYEGNDGLCGVPLSRTCAILAPSPLEKEENSDASVEVEWKAVAVGYVSGFVIAAVIGQKMITSGLINWFAGAIRLGHRRRQW